MRIHHFTLPAHDPARVAHVLAELLGARVIPMPHPEAAFYVYAGDADGSVIEVWPANTRAGAGDLELTSRDLPLPAAWPHHAFVTSDACDADAILAVFAREGWQAARAYNGTIALGFGLVRGYIENHTAIEIGGREMRTQYERFSRERHAVALRDEERAP